MSSHASPAAPAPAPASGFTDLNLQPRQLTEFRDLVVAANNASRTYNGSRNKLEVLKAALEGLRHFAAPIVAKTGLNEDVVLTTLAAKYHTAFSSGLSRSRVQELAFNNFLPQKIGRTSEYKFIFDTLTVYRSPAQLVDGMLIKNTLLHRHGVIGYQPRLSTALKALFELDISFEDFKVIAGNHESTTSQAVDYVIISVPTLDLQIAATDSMARDVFIRKGIADAKFWSNVQASELAQDKAVASISNVHGDEFQRHLHLAIEQVRTLSVPQSPQAVLVTTPAPAPAPAPAPEPTPAPEPAPPAALSAPNEPILDEHGLPAPADPKKLTGSEIRERMQAFLVHRAQREGGMRIVADPITNITRELQERANSGENHAAIGIVDTYKDQSPWREQLANGTPKNVVFLSWLAVQLETIADLPEAQHPGIDWRQVIDALNYEATHYNHSVPNNHSVPTTPRQRAGKVGKVNAPAPAPVLAPAPAPVLAQVPALALAPTSPTPPAPPANDFDGDEALSPDTEALLVKVFGKEGLPKPVTPARAQRPAPQIETTETIAARKAQIILDMIDYARAHSAFPSTHNKQDDTEVRQQWKEQARWLQQHNIAGSLEEYIDGWVIAQAASYRPKHKDRNPDHNAGEVAGFENITWAIIENCYRKADNPLRDQLKKVLSPDYIPAQATPPSRAAKVFAEAATDPAMDPDWKTKAEKARRIEARKAEVLSDMIGHIIEKHEFPSIFKSATPTEKNLWGKHMKWLNKNLSLSILEFLKDWIKDKADEYATQHDGKKPDRTSGEVAGFGGLTWEMLATCCDKLVKSARTSLDVVVGTITEEEFKLSLTSAKAAPKPNKSPASKSADTGSPASADESELTPRKNKIIQSMIEYVVSHNQFPSLTRETDPIEVRRYWGAHEQWLRKHTGSGNTEFFKAWTRQQAKIYAEANDGAHPTRHSGLIVGFEPLTWKHLAVCYESLWKAAKTSLEEVLGIAPNHTTQTDASYEGLMAAVDNLGQGSSNIVKVAFDGSDIDQRPAPRPIPFNAAATPAPAPVPAPAPAESFARAVTAEKPDPCMHMYTLDKPTDVTDLMKRVLEYCDKKEKFPHLIDAKHSDAEAKFWASQDKWISGFINMGLQEYIIRWIRGRAEDYRRNHNGMQPDENSGPINGFEDYDWMMIYDCCLVDPEMSKFEEIISRRVDGSPVQVAEFPQSPAMPARK